MNFENCREFFQYGPFQNEDDVTDDELPDWTQFVITVDEVQQHAEPKNKFVQKNTLTGQILIHNLKDNLKKILNTSLITNGNSNFIIL